LNLPPYSHKYFSPIFPLTEITFLKDVLAVQKIEIQTRCNKFCNRMSTKRYEIPAPSRPRTFNTPSSLAEELSLHGCASDVSSNPEFIFSRSPFRKRAFAGIVRRKQFPQFSLHASQTLKQTIHVHQQHPRRKCMLSMMRTFNNSLCSAQEFFAGITDRNV
jgi:hypothetical protein